MDLFPFKDILRRDAVKVFFDKGDGAWLIA
jgi:hypothetical protein